MKDNKEAGISYLAAHLTTIVSVTLVLLAVGVIGMLTFAGARETRHLKEKLELSVVLADSVSDAGTSRLFTTISRQPFVLEPRLVSRGEALEKWEAETGENLETTFGVNPLSPEITFRVAARYSQPQSIARIKDALGALPGVDGIAAPDASVVEAMNSNIEKLTLILGGLALVMVVISFVLINNTVHLSIHSRRFTIHTMQLVGATDGFIRRPFVTANLWSGLIAGALASGLIALAIASADRMGVPELSRAADWGDFGIVAGVLVVLGGLLCISAAALATTRYLHRDYAALVMK